MTRPEATATPGVDRRCSHAEQHIAYAGDEHLIGPARTGTNHRSLGSGQPMGGRGCRGDAAAARTKVSKSHRCRPASSRETRDAEQFNTSPS